MKTKIKVLTKTKKIETLLLTKKELKNLKNLLIGRKCPQYLGEFIQDYNTINGKIITDLDIESICPKNQEPFLTIEISEHETYTLYSDGCFYSQQSDNNNNPTDIPQYLFDLRDFVLTYCKRMKHLP